MLWATWAGQIMERGTIKSERVLLHNVVSPFWTGPLRSPQRLQNTFAHESFMDELAARTKADPVEFRLRHLSEPRMIDVVKAAAKTANWVTRPSPNPRAISAKAAGIASGRGMACVSYEGDNGYATMVAEVESGTSNRKIDREAHRHQQRFRPHLQSRRAAQSVQKAARSRA